jgi:processive 1,2-diacylglycerol beta-glucosyltransferase
MQRLTLWRVLILTSSTGSGHDRRAYALKEWMDHLLSDRVEVHVEHLLENSFFLTRFGVHLYNFIQKHGPFLHRIYWHIAERFIGVQKDKVVWGKGYYERLIRSFKPHLIVSVHDCLNRGFFEDARRILGKDRVRCVTYCGEWSGGEGYSLNWVNPSADLFVGRTPEALDYAYKQGIEPQKSAHWVNFVSMNDWYQYEDNPQRAQLLKNELGLFPDKFTLLLGTGQFGANHHLRFLEALCRFSDQLQIIVVCGKNTRILKKLRIWQVQHPELRMHLEGFSSRMITLMQASDIILTRGGANSAAEALLTGCPILFNGMGGVMPQEWLTIRYFTNREAGCLVKSPQECLQQIENWLAHPLEFEALRMRFRALQQKDHPVDFVRTLQTLCNTR